MAKRTGRRLSTDARRRELIELGRRLFDEHPYESLSVDDIAAAAGISKGLLYHYFPGKRAFYVAVVESAAESLIADTLQASEGAEEPFIASLDALIDFVLERRESFLFLMRRSDAEVRPILDRVRARFAERFVENGVDQIAAAGVVAFAEAALLKWLETGADDRSALRALIAKVALAISE